MFGKTEIKRLEHPNMLRQRVNAYQAWGLYRTATKKNLDTIAKPKPLEPNKQLNHAVDVIQQYAWWLSWSSPKFQACANQSQIVKHSYDIYYNSKNTDQEEKTWFAWLSSFDQKGLLDLKIALLTKIIAQPHEVKTVSNISISALPDQTNNRLLLDLLDCYRMTLNQPNENTCQNFQEKFHKLCKKMTSDHYEALHMRLTELHVLKEFASENYLKSVLLLAIAATAATVMFPNTLLFVLLSVTCFNLIINIITRSFIPALEAIESSVTEMQDNSTRYIPR